MSPDSATTERVAPVYVEINSLWSADTRRTPVAFQMNGPQPSTYCEAMIIAVEHHAQSVELWPRTGPGAGGFAAVPSSTLVAWDKALRTGRPPVCTG